MSSTSPSAATPLGAMAAAIGSAAVAWLLLRRPRAAEEDTEAARLVAPGLNLSSLVVERVLSESRESKRVAVLGRWRGREDEGQALVVVEKAPLEGGPAALSALFARGLRLSPTLANPPYAFFEASLRGGGAGAEAAKVEVIFPCTERHVRKYTRGVDVVLRETPEAYRQRHEPLIPPAAHLGWVQAILDGSAEAERVLAADPDPATGWLLLPDSKWSAGHDRAEDMYLLALVRDAALRSLRDLRAEHLPLLRGLRRGCLDTARERFGHPESRVMMYLHYAPSYYHLHVHVVATSRAAGNDRAGRAHLLDDVIDNLERNPAHYAEATLTMRVAGTHALAGAADP